MASDYPTENDLMKFLAATGLIDNPPTGDAAGLEYGVAVRAAAGEYERRTGRRRITAAQARSFAMPGGKDGILDPGQSFTAVTSVTLDGQALVADTDYFLLPVTAPNDGLPFRRIEFHQRTLTPHLWGSQKSLVITATWGEGATVPDDVWHAILARAGQRLLPQVMLLESGGRTKWTHADASQEWGSGKMEEFRKAWAADFERVIRDYRMNLIS